METRWLRAMRDRVFHVSRIVGQLDKITASTSDINASISRIAGQLDRTHLPGPGELRVTGPLTDRDLYVGLFGNTSVANGPDGVLLTSGLCQQAHFGFHEYRYWLSRLQLAWRLHRKDWEWFYICQALHERGKLGPGAQGLAFAVGQEPLPALFAAIGCKITASDQAEEEAVRQGWTQSGQHSKGLDQLARPSICPDHLFRDRVSFLPIDMNDLPTDINGQYDFCWSSCSFEHLGSLRKGMDFVLNSMNCLKSGGIAVHTTEFNLTSNSDTIETEGLSIYRERDIRQLAAELEAAGHDVAPIDLERGSGFAETVVDLPPYKGTPHLRLRLGDYDCTSVGIIITKR